VAQEIERKYLLSSNSWKSLSHKKIRMHQGYLCNNHQSSVRIRIEDQSANINIKSMTVGISRAEYEYSIPVDEAAELLATLCKKPQIQKERYLVNHADKLWEIDVFAGDNEGLVVAEIELESEDEAIELPEWIDKEVSHHDRYYNMRLTSYPYSQWSEAEKRGD
jgi:adenylate cyclase